jgi:uncharacterized membrane protein YgcG
MTRLTAFACVAVLLIGSGFTSAWGKNTTTSRVLNQVQPEMKFTNVTLAEALDYIRDVSGVNMHVDWKTLETVNVTKDTMVNVRVRSVSLRKALSLVLSEAGEGHLLTFYVDDNVLEVTTREFADKQLITKVYPVEDLITDIPDFTAADENLNLGSLSSGSTVTGTSGGMGGGGGSGGGSSIFGGSSGSSSGQTQASKKDRANELVSLIKDVIQPEIWRDNGGPASIRYYNGSLIVTAPRSVHEALGGPLD